MAGSPGPSGRNGTDGRKGVVGDSVSDRVRGRECVSLF